MLVSVVIPTHGRPDLVGRAVQSCLAQTLRDIEVLVILDGPDKGTVDALAQIRDPRLRVEVLEKNQGPSAARNRGVELAGGEWVAFLDDDDEWIETKLSIQYRVAIESQLRYPIVSCRFLARTDRGDLLWPRRLPDPGESLNEYLFCQRTLMGGEGMVLPSTILARVELLRIVPFNPSIRRHHDVDWLLKAIQVPGTGVEFPSEPGPLAIWHMESGHGRISDFPDWKQSLQWVQENPGLLSGKTLGAFLLTWASLSGARTRDWDAFHTLLLEALRTGKPRAIDLASHFVIWFVPENLRRVISILMQRRPA